MQGGSRSLVVLGFTGLLCLGPGADVSNAQQPIAIESVFPAQLPRGQKTVVNVAFPGRDLAVQSAEIAPMAGIAITGLKRGTESQGVSWWEMTFDVAKDAAPGERALVLVMPMGRTLPATVTVPTHVPSISDVKVVSAQPNQPTLEVQFAAVDESADLGDSPYVWFTFGCNESVVGVVKGKVTGGIVHATLPSPHPAGATPATGSCDLRVRATDSGGIESNTLNTTVDFKK